MTFRRQTATGILLWITLLLFMYPSHADDLLDRIIAVVDNETITQQELSRGLASARTSLGQQNANIDDQTLLAQVLQQLITRKLQLQEAEKLNIRIDEITLDRTIAQMAQNYKMNLIQFKQRIEQDGGNYELLREQMREKLTITRLTQREVIDKMEVSEEEIKNYLTAKSDQTNEKTEYHLAHWKATPNSNNQGLTELYRNATLHMRNTLTKENIYSFAKLKRRNSELWNEFWKARGYTGKSSDAKDKKQLPLPPHTLIDLGWKRAEELPATIYKYIRNIHTGEITAIISNKKSLHWFYLLGVRNKDHSIRKNRYHVRHILLQTNPLEDDDFVKTRLLKMKRAIEKSDNFEGFARKYSKDPGSSYKGGDLGWADPQGFVPEFTEAIMQADAEGGIIGPVHSNFGWHLVEVLGKREEDIGDTMARQEAIAEIKKSRLQEEQRLWLLKLREDRYIEVRL